jgi:hypothetical protein
VVAALRTVSGPAWRGLEGKHTHGRALPVVAAPSPELGFSIQSPLGSPAADRSLYMGPVPQEGGRRSSSAWHRIAGQGGPGSRGPSGSSLLSCFCLLRRCYRQPGGNEHHSEGTRPRNGGRPRSLFSLTAARSGSLFARWCGSRSIYPAANQGALSPDRRASLPRPGVHPHVCLGARLTWPGCRAVT